MDFIELRRAHGAPLADAVIDAGTVRFRPMLLTAAAVVVGASVILSDPIFQGLALSLIAGAVASTLLSWPTIPVLYYMIHSRKPETGIDAHTYSRGDNAECDTSECDVVQVASSTKKGELMTVERAVRMMAGVITLISVALGHYVSPLLVLLNLYLWGSNPLQSAFTRPVPRHATIFCATWDWKDSGSQTTR